MAEVSTRLATLRPGVALRRHQLDALDGVGKVLARGRRRAWVVLPPGAGKTVVGLEAARRLGQPIVAFAPNVAIQSQWLAEWSRFAPDPPPGSADRGLGAAVTALTYQSLATFDPDAEVDPDGHDRGVHVQRLRTSGRELITALGRRPVTLVLDECHHLLDVWGELLAEVLERLPDATVIGLTATPPSALTRDERALVDRLFGRMVTGPSIPAMVREGVLVPFAELGWLTTPTGREQAWLAAQAERFAHLTADLIDPSFATVGFLPWLDRFAVRRDHHAGDGPAVPWHRFARDQPEVADAVLRFHHAGMLALPEGARLHEQHRHAPSADDWMRLLHVYAHRFLARSDDLRDAHAYESIRAALPGVGYRLTRHGVRSGRSPVDRVIARSAGKIEATGRILAAEHEALGERLRAAVICDHEQARATLPSGLVGVLDADAGSARLALRHLAGLPGLRPLLVTGRTVAAGADVARAFLEYAAQVAPDLRLEPVSPAAAGVVQITGRGVGWTPRRWVPLVTGFFASGGSLTLIGTRAILGEGWDCAAVNTLVDLTEATTGTSVVQLRGRALRLDPAWPDKVAHTWSVVCVADNHPKGAADFERFVRKHDGYYGVTEHGTVMAGVTNVDPSLSAYAPPPVMEFDQFNQRMLRRCGARSQVQELWRVGEAYADRPVHVLRVVNPSPVGERVSAPQPPAAVPTRLGLSTDTRTPPWPIAAPAASVAAVALLTVGAGAAGIALIVVALLCACAHARGAYQRGRQLRHVALFTNDVPAMAYATADALRAAGQTDRGADAVTIAPDQTGAWQFHLTGVAPAVSERYATALDEVLSAPADPRYLIGRYVLPDPGAGWWATLRAGWRLPARWARPHAVAYHALPTVLAEHRRHADTFARSWRHWVSDWPQPVYTRSPEGALLLASRRGLSPLDVQTAQRVTWE